MIGRARAQRPGAGWHAVHASEVLLHGRRNGLGPRGACILVEAFDAGDALELIERHGITFMFGVPTMFHLMARHPRWQEADLSSLRILNCGSSSVPTPLITTYQERGLTFQQGYGMTETTPGACFLSAEHSVAKAGSTGVPPSSTDIRVVRRPTAVGTEKGP